MNKLCEKMDDGLIDESAMRLSSVLVKPENQKL
jgi:hypothetical protein